MTNIITNAVIYAAFSISTNMDANVTWNTEAQLWQATSGVYSNKLLCIDGDCFTIRSKRIKTLVREQSRSFNGAEE